MWNGVFAPSLNEIKTEIGKFKNNKAAIAYGILEERRVDKKHASTHL